MKAEGWTASASPAAFAGVVIKGADGREVTGTTLADGRFQIDVTGLPYPALVKITIPNPATGDLSVLWGALAAAPAGELAITPLTTAVVAGLANGDPETLFKALGRSTSATIAVTGARIASAENSVRIVLPTLATADMLANAVPSSVGFIFAPVWSAISGVEAFLKKLSSDLTTGSLASVVATAVEPVKVGCDLADLSRMAGGALRPDCEPTPNLPVSWTVADRLVPVERDRPQDPTARADELAGVPRGENWKFYKPGVSREQILAVLRPKLKSMIEDLWSNNGGILFPESYDYLSKPVEYLVDSIIDIQWERIPKKLKTVEVSNLSFEYQVLRLRLQQSDPANLFFATPLNAVSLATVHWLDPNVDLDPKPYPELNTLSTKVGAFARAWLRDVGNRPAAGTVAPEILAVGAGVQSIIDAAAAFNASTTVSTIETLRTQLEVAIGALPSAYVGLGAPAREYGTWWRDWAQCMANVYNNVPNPPSCEASALTSSGQQKGYDYSAAYSQVSTSSAASSGETNLQFWTRFIGALAEFVNDEYENKFGTNFTTDDGVWITYWPIVITADLRDTAVDTSPFCCFTSPTYQDAYRSATLYRVPGENVSFERNLDGTSGTDLAPAQIVREDFSAPPLSQRAGSKLAGPFEVVNTTKSTMFNAHVYTLACASADTACMQRLASSKFSSPLDTIGSGVFGFSIGFHALMKILEGGPGISEFWGPVPVRRP